MNLEKHKAALNEWMVSGPKDQQFLFDHATLAFRFIDLWEAVSANYGAGEDWGEIGLALEALEEKASEIYSND